MSALSIGESQCLTVFCINPGKGCCKRKKQNRRWLVCNGQIIVAQSHVVVQ